MNQNDIIGLLEKKISISKKSCPSFEYSQSYRKGKWTSEEDENLRYYLSIFGERNWKKVSEHMEGRSSIQCLHRWTKILKPGLVKGPWTLEEDKKLIEWVQKEGAIKWSRAAQYIPGRSGKQCRERWLNNLSPNLKKSNWNDEEDELIFALYKKYGSAWSKIAKHFNGRTENSIKNRFYSTIRRLALDRSRQSTQDTNTIINGNTVINANTNIDGNIDGNINGNINTNSNNINAMNMNKIEENKEPIFEKIQIKKQKNDLIQQQMNNGEVQSILQELTQNYKNAERKEAFPIKKEYLEEIKPVIKDQNPCENVNDYNILRSLMMLEKGFNNLRNEALDLQEKRSQGGIDIKSTENNLNEVFNGFLMEEQVIDQNILQLIRQIKNIECLLMDKTKEHLEKEMILKQEQMDSNEQGLKRKGLIDEGMINWTAKKIKVV